MAVVLAGVKDCRVLECLPGIAGRDSSGAPPPLGMTERLVFVQRAAPCQNLPSRKSASKSRAP